MELSADRGAMLLDAIRATEDGIIGFADLADEYREMDGPEGDLRTTLVAMLADIGCWIGKGPEGLQSAIAIAEGSRPLNDDVEGDAAEAVRAIITKMKWSPECGPDAVEEAINLLQEHVAAPAM